MGSLAIATLPVYMSSFDWMVDFMAAFAKTPQGYTLFSISRYAICLAVMLPATFCAGMTLPLITRVLVGGGRRRARDRSGLRREHVRLDRRRGARRSGADAAARPQMAARRGRVGRHRAWRRAPRRGASVAMDMAPARRRQLVVAGAVAALLVAVAVRDELRSHGDDERRVSLRRRASRRESRMCSSTRTAARRP